MSVLKTPDLNCCQEQNTADHEIGYPVHVYFIELSKMYMQRVRWHWHPEVEVLIVNHGEADFLTDDQKLRLKAGQGILVNQNIIHSIQPVDTAANCSLYSMVFHPSFLFGYGNTVMSSKFLTPVLSSPVFKTMLLNESDPVHEKLLDPINNAIAANLTKKYGYELITKSYLCQFWFLLLEQIVPQNANQNKHSMLSLDEMRVKEAILYIETHYAEQITLEELAGSIHISKSECCRCFKRTLQMSPVEYIKRYRIFKAANMIQFHAPAASSISDLAFNVGFNNASYFNKVFRQFLQCTPSEYKRNLKKGAVKNPLNPTVL